MKWFLSFVLGIAIVSCTGSLVSAQEQQDVTIKSEPAVVTQETTNIYGTVKSLDIDKKELILESNDANTGQLQEYILKVNDDTEIEYELELGDIAVGDNLDIEYTTDEAGNRIARTIKFAEAEGEIEEEEEY